MTEGALTDPAGHTEPTALGDGHRQRNQLGELRRRVDHLWRVEPSAAPSTRSGLLELLARLDLEIERLALRLHDGDPVDDERVRACADQVDELTWWWGSPDADRATA